MIRLQCLFKGHRWLFHPHRATAYYSCRRCGKVKSQAAFERGL